jgi:hypothetical protein
MATRYVPSPSTGWLPARLPVQADYACAAPGDDNSARELPGRDDSRGHGSTGSESLEGFRPSHLESVLRRTPGDGDY